MVAKGHVMTLRERLRTLPADAIWGYGAVIGYVATLATHVVAGPNLVLMVFTLLVLLLLGVIGSILGFRLLWGATSRQRVLPLVVVCICPGESPDRTHLALHRGSTCRTSLFGWRSPGHHGMGAEVDRHPCGSGISPTEP